MKKKINIDIFHIFWLKPFKIKKEFINSLKNTKKGLVIDSTYEICSISEHISYRLMHEGDFKVYSYGMKDKSPGCSKNKINGTPTTKNIINKILKIINE